VRTVYLQPDPSSTAPEAHTTRLDIDSTVDMVELVQVVSDHVARAAGFGEEALRELGLAVRECVSNAITHGNRRDPLKRVFIELTTRADLTQVELAVSVRDQGRGFDPSVLQSPTDPDRLLETGGRGVFLMRQLMDDVSLEIARDGGMAVTMVKRRTR
jgi:serine/threonine-protein kinase RsbW